ncbi:Txe/YoeB family addiction module toxin [Microaerobacter geothermalis]|uniref:Txe/YoeB family addiction module toxin n=1 Tax=Microaerobacter geothermalis TaxID=674972 RepID=UPI001F24A7EB|nr:Txe/YoeB family addiction module toxin [Microaerobacter geothermalis]MCF6092797.1 Txe/YoeB family addiction module toxin [Microaerobacter geothermalis]
MEFRLIFSKQAVKDAKRLEQTELDKKAKELLKLIKTNPFQTPPPFEKLVGDLAGKYSRRINIQHRIVYAIDQNYGVIKVYRMWSHYE